MTDEKKIKDEELANITGAGVADLGDKLKDREEGGGSGGTSTAEAGETEHPSELSEN